MNFFSICALLGGIIALSTGIFVYFKSREVFVYKTYIVSSLTVALWSVGYFLFTSASDNKTAILGYWIHNVSIFIPATHLYFVLALLGIHEKRKTPLLICFSCSFLLYILSFSPYYINGLVPKHIFNYYVDPGIGYYFFAIHFTFWVMYAFYELFTAIPKDNKYKSVQLKLFTGASIVGFAGGGTVFLLTFNIPVPPYGLILFAIYPIIITYAIVRYRFMDIKIAVKRTMAYSLSVGFLTGIFVVLVLTITKLFSSVANVDSFEISIFSALVIALLFNPLRTQIQAIIDKVFYKKTYDYYATVKKVSSNLASIFDLRNIYEFISGTIYEVLGLRSIYLLTASAGGGYEVVKHITKESKKGKLKKIAGDDEGFAIIHSRSEISRYCKKSSDIIIKDELPAIEVEQGRDIMERIKNELEPFHAEALIPVFVDNKLALILLLGEKMSGDMFTNEDINLLSTISDQTAIALKNSALYKDKMHSERLASIGMMSATFAHEIRNPLTSLKTFAQLMPEKYNDEEFRDTFSKIVVSEIERINDLIGDLLDFSMEKQSGYVNEFNLESFIDEIIEYIKGRLEVEKENIRIEKVYNNNGIELSGSMEKLKQAFINIVNNGCQAMHGEGVLTVEIVPNANNVDISISDTGEGIPPEDISKIFDPFVTTKEMGVGLGLAISKRIIEDHDGKIQVKSKLSEGTTFTVSLPMLKA